MFIMHIYWFQLPILLFIFDLSKGWKELKGKKKQKISTKRRAVKKFFSFNLWFFIHQKVSHITWCIEMNTIEIPSRKFTVKVWPNNAADAMPVKIVATVDEYFFKIVSGNIEWHPIDKSAKGQRCMYNKSLRLTCF